LAIAVRRFSTACVRRPGAPEEKRMKTLRDCLIAVLVVLAWGVVAHVADADLRERQRTPRAAQGAA
jgi:hypothetical protein